MGSQKPDFEGSYYDFRGGIDTKHAAYMVFDNQLVTAEDSILHRGGIRKTSGHSAVFGSIPAASRGLSLFRAYDLVSGTKLLYQLATGRAYRVSGTTAAAIGSVCGASAKLSWTVANRKVYAANGTAYRAYSGNAAVAMYSATAPAQTPRFVYYHQDSNRLFAGRGTTAVNRVYFSDINAFETWPSNNFFDIPESRMGDQVTGFSRLFGNLVIFGERTISILYGRVPSDYRLRTLEWNNGCPFPFSIAEFDGYVMYARPNGIFKFDGSGPAQKLSDSIDSIVGDITVNENGPVGTPTSEGFYLLSYKSKTATPANNALQNDREITVIPPSQEAPYWHFQGPNKRGFSHYSRWTGSTDSDETYAITSDTTGQLAKLTGRYLYLNSDIDMVLETKQYDLGSPFIRKVFSEIEIHVEAVANITLRAQYKVDNEVAWRDLGAINLGKTGPVYGDKLTDQTDRNRIIHPIVIDESAAPVGNCIQLRFRQQTVHGSTATNLTTNILGWAIRGYRWGISRGR